LAYVLGRCALTFLKAPKSGMDMFRGWLFHGKIKRLDVAEYVNEEQKKNLLRKALKKISSGFI